MIQVTITTSGKQAVEEALRQFAKNLSGPLQVLVGVPKAAEPYEDGLTTATVAAVNEFGSADGHIPARPFLYPAIAENGPKYLRLARAELPDILDGKEPMTRLLHRLGLIAVGDVQQKIVDVRTPPNAPSTIAKKGSDNPLIDTGHLRQSINYEIVDGSENIEEGIR